MKWAILTLNKKSIVLAKRIKELIKDKKIDIYTMPRYADDEIKPIEGGLKKFNEYIFEEYKTIIYIMAVGIVVRDISEYIKHKSVDPAVLVIDSEGKFVISLLSGHLGGANEKAEYLANKIKAIPVITTASDVAGKVAVDMIAKKHNLEITNFQKAKEITAMIVNDEKVGIISDIQLNKDIINNIPIIKSELKDINGIIYISNRNKFKLTKPYVHLVPKNIVVGIGCKRGTEEDKIIDFLKVCLETCNLHPSSIIKFASIDLKKDEIGIINTAKRYNAEFITYSIEELAKVESDFDQSDFVKKTIGIGAVCEPSGFLASNEGKCILSKHNNNGITISIWEETS